MTISTVRKLPIINGYVAIPDGQILHPTSITPEQALSLIPGSKIVRLGPGAPATPFSVTYTANNDDTQRRSREQMYLELPAFSAPGGYSGDWFKTLRDAAS